jgi:alpha-galactosidase
MERIIGRISWEEKGHIQQAEFSARRPLQQGGLGVALEGSETDLAVRLTVQAGADIVLRSLAIDLRIIYPISSTIFANGFQSWTESREFKVEERNPPLRAPFEHLLRTTGDYSFFKMEGKAGYFHSHAYTYRYDEFYALTGWTDLVRDYGYTIFEHRTPAHILRIHKDCAGLSLTHDCVPMHIQRYEGERAFVMDQLLAAYRPIAAPRPVTGWTSWYNYYTDIDADIIRSNIRAFADLRIPADIFQIDDGWQRAIGDWTEANDKFPEGMKALADEVHAAGFQAGLWLAPFIVEHKSRILEEHPDWLLTYDGEHRVQAGINPGWGGTWHSVYYALDLTLPAVQDHLRHVFRVVLDEWGFDLVKLDFLFAGGLLPQGGRTRGQQMQAAMRLLRACVGDKRILGCGVPLEPAFGLVDYCRIGPDVGLNWDMRSAELIHLRERISTHNALRNTISRHHLAGRAFANDPDVFLLRDTHNQLSPAERDMGFVLNMVLGDLVFTSDHIGEYDPATLRRFRSAFPNHPKVIQAILFGPSDLPPVDVFEIEFEITGRCYLALVNLSERDWYPGLPPKTAAQLPTLWWRCRQGLHSCQITDYMDEMEVVVPARSCQLYLHCGAELPCVLGSNLHLFPGAEVQALALDGDRLTLRLHPGALQEGELCIGLPHDLVSIEWEGRRYPTERMRDRNMVRLRFPAS